MGSHLSYTLSRALTADTKIRLGCDDYCFFATLMDLTFPPQVCLLSSCLTAFAIEVGFPCVVALNLIGVKVGSVFNPYFSSRGVGFFLPQFCTAFKRCVLTVRAKTGG